MLLFYKLYIFLMKNGIGLAATFNPKAKQWHAGRKGLLKKIKQEYRPAPKTLWVHAASLGEFEQGRPVIETFKAQHPDYQVVLTFFSPSGYEIRKNYAMADHVFYLPTDTASNAQQFIDIIQPNVVLFVKYEFWYFFLKALKQRNIPCYLVSGIFREKQLFFKPYGGWYRGILGYFDHLFVQEVASEKLLHSIGIRNVTVTGDTRFDRVGQITDKVKAIPLAQEFKGKRQLLIAGSSWPPDEEIICRYLNEASPQTWCWIIAPHQIDAPHIDKLIRLISPQKKVLKYSEATLARVADADVLVIDNIGLLSSLYAYGDIAYIGGGFGAGIHNTLEAATFGMPVLFGPNHQRFNEALQLMEIGGAFSFADYNTFKPLLDKCIHNVSFRKQAAKQSANYVRQNRGATARSLALIDVP